MTSQHEALHRLFVTSLSLHFSESWGDGSANVTVGFQRRKTLSAWHLLAPATYWPPRLSKLKTPGSFGLTFLILN